MSHLQFGTLKYIVTHDDLHLSDVENLNLTTFGSLVQRGWVKRKGTRILGTQAGVDAYSTYIYAMANYRQHAGEISDRVRTLLHIGELRMLKHAPVEIRATTKAS